MSTIPANELVAVNPSVLGVGGSAIDLTGLMLTTSTRPPIGQVLSFPDSDSVATFFGSGSTEASAADNYFSAFVGASKLPGALLFAQYNETAVAAYIRGGDVADLTLDEIKAVSGQFLITVDGTQITVADVDLSSATSFSSAASLLQTQLNADAGPDVAVSYDSVSGAFVIASASTGATSTIGYASGSGDTDTVLKLTQATGATLSQGADAASPDAFMDDLIAVNSAWASFTTLFDPDVSGHAVKLAFADWKNTQNNRFAYVCWDLDVTPTTTLPATASLGYALENNNDSGTFLIDGDPASGWLEAAGIAQAAFVMGTMASIDFTERDGRITFAYKAQAGLSATVTSAVIANNLGGNPQSSSRGNGYNFYGAYGAANDGFTFLQRGFVTGPFAWMDSYAVQIWLNNSFQIALLNLMATAKSIPYSNAGYNRVETALADIIQQALAFGAFGPGDITAAQAAAVNGEAGKKISDALQTQGYYLQVGPASALQRAGRTSPPSKFWYLDRGSIQSITLDSIALQ